LALTGLTAELTFATGTDSIFFTGAGAFLGDIRSQLMDAKETVNNVIRSNETFFNIIPPYLINYTRQLLKNQVA
jgi:hypothetical protein